MKLTPFGGRSRSSAPAKAPGQARTTLPGYVNSSRQEVLSRTGFPSSTSPGQTIYKLRCQACRYKYGANGCDIHNRRCPKCQNGAQGETLREAAATLFD